MKEHFSIVEDKKVGLYYLMVRHQSPFEAARWLNLIIDSIHRSSREDDIAEAKGTIEFLNRQRKETSVVSLNEVFAQLIEEQTKKLMLANVSEDYIFDIIDPPFVPETRAAPNRTIICIFGVFAGGVLSLLAIGVLVFAGKLRPN